MPTTPNMDLLLPIVESTIGPTYASENNNAFTTIDSHDHTTGKGVPVPSAGLNINADLTFAGYNATNLRASRFQSQTSALSLPADINELYVVSGNLFYNNNLGQQVQITSGASLDATSVGGFGGDYATSTALAFYTTSTRTFTFWSANNTPANLDAGSVTIRPVAVSPSGITLSAPTGLSSSYTLTFPSSLPSATSAIQVDPSGNVTFSGGNTPSGGIIMWGGVTAPSGWLLCDGTSYLRTAQPGIFAAIGTAYGAIDSLHFNVPDMRGQFPRGVSGTSGVDPDAASRGAQYTGGNTGNNVGSSQDYATQSHTHSVTAVEGAGGTILPPLSGGTTGYSYNTNANSGLVSSETRPTNVYFNFIIKQ